MTNFNWTNPGILWGLLALAIPIVIHFLLKRTPYVEHWGASRFLRVALNRKQVQLQVQSLSQLLIRLAILCLLVTSAAEPQFNANSQSNLSNGPVHRLLVLDVSMSMAVSRNGRSRFDELQRQVGSLLANHKEGDSWQVLLHGINDSPDRIRIPLYDTDALKEELSKLAPTWQSADLSETLQRAIAFADEFPGNLNEVYFWTDLPASEWKPSGSDAYEVGERLNQLSRLAHVSIIDLSQKPSVQSTQNLYIRDVRVQKEDLKTGQPCLIMAKIENSSDDSITTSVQLIVNSEVIAEKTIEVSPNLQQEFQFETVFTKEAIHRCAIRLPEDSLGNDNIFHFAVPIKKAPKVLIVENSTPTQADLKQSNFLELALSPPEELENPSTENASEITVVSPSGFIEQTLIDYDVVILAGVQSLSATESLRLLEFVESGGGLMISMSDQIPVAQYNERLGINGVNLLPAILEKRVSIDLNSGKPFQLEAASQKHPVVKQFQLHPESGLTTTRIYSYLQSTPTTESHVERVVNLDSGAPLIIEKKVGQGKVMLVTTSFSLEWGSWVLWPSFVPMIRESVLHLARNQNIIIPSTIGEPPPETVVPLQDIASIYNEEQDLVWDSQFGSDQILDLFERYLTNPDLYFLRSANSQEPIQVIAANADTRESSAPHANPLDLLRSSIMKGQDVEILEDAKFSSSIQRATGSGTESFTSRWLVFFAVLLLLVDQIFSLQSQLAFRVIFGMVSSALFALLFGLSASLTVIVVLTGMILGVILEGTHWYFEKWKTR